MRGGFVLGGVVAWLVVSFFSGGLLPAFSVQTFLAVFVGGIIGTAVEAGLLSQKTGS